MRAKSILLPLIMVLGAWEWGLFSCDPAAAAQKSSCNRACLTGYVDRYLEALVKHDPKAAPLAANARFTENGLTAAFGEGLWKTAIAVKARQYFLDPSTGQAAFFGVVDEGSQLTIFGLRLKIDGQEITEIETLVARKGAHPLFAPEALFVPPHLFAEALKPRERVSRKNLISAADNYFNAIEQHDGNVAPFDPQCARFENGVQTTGNPQINSPLGCIEGMQLFTYIPTVRDRRYPIVDEERGLIFSIIVFDMPGTATTAVINGKTVELTESQRLKRSLLLMEVFKVVGGRILQIEAFMCNRPFGAPSGWN